MRSIKILAAVAALSLVSSAFAETYKIDPVHSGVTFAAHHAGAGWVPGRFNQVSGEMNIADDIAKSTFTVEIPVDSLNTNNDKRDQHLKSPDFFNAKQYPAISFKSTSVEKTDDTHLKVTGDLTLHGVTKSISFPLELTGTGEFPAGTKRYGVRASFTVKLSDYAIKGLPGVVGDEIELNVMFEGAK